MYDDNFGFYGDGDESMDDREETIRFYRRNQRDSVSKRCRGCNRKVRLLPDYAYCNSCADKRERGMDI